MVLNYFGEGCFRLQSGDLSVLINPTNNRLKADVTLRTIASGENPLAEGEIGIPGEYEVKGIDVQGWEIKEESTPKYVKTIFQVTWEDMRFVFLGHISQPLAAEVLEEIAEPDVLFVPTGDSHFIDAAEAAKLVKKLEPKVIVPSFYKNANELVKALGVKPENEEKFVFKKKDLADAKSRLLVLESKG